MIRPASFQKGAMQLIGEGCDNDHAFAAYWQGCQERLVKSISRRLYDCNASIDAWDILQDVSIKAWLAFDPDRCDNEYQFFAWVYRIATGTIIDKWKTSNAKYRCEEVSLSDTRVFDSKRDEDAEEDIEIIYSPGLMVESPEVVLFTNMRTGEEMKFLNACIDRLNDWPCHQSKARRSAVPIVRAILRHILDGKKYTQQAIANHYGFERKAVSRAWLLFQELVEETRREVTGE